MKARPQSVLAKEDAKVTADHRKSYSLYDADVVKYGQRVADYNAGFIVGQEDGEEQLSHVFTPVFRALTKARPEGKWSAKERADWEAAFKALKDINGFDPMKTVKRKGSSHAVQGQTQGRATERQVNP